MLVAHPLAQLRQCLIRSCGNGLSQYHLESGQFGQHMIGLRLRRNLLQLSNPPRPDICGARPERAF
jgi:hypothetical protein